MFNRLQKTIIMSDFFRELLLISVGVRCDFSSTPTARNWAELFRLAKKHALLGVCFSGVQTVYDRHPELLSELPPNLKMSWLGAAAMIQERNALMDSRCVELQDRLSSDGIKSCILKGQGVASCYGSLGECRQSGDIDVFVDADRASSLRYLAEHGIDNNGWDYVHAHPLFFDDVEVELHYRLSVFRNPFRNRKFQNFVAENKASLFEGLAELSDGMSVTVPSDWMNLLYLLHHIYRHLFSEGIGLRQVMDYYFALKSVDLSDDDRLRLVSSVRDFGMEGFAGGLMWVLGDVFNLSESFMPWIPDENEGRFILSEIMASGNFGHSDMRFGDYSGGKMQKFIHAFRRSLHLVTRYPGEACWTPFYYLWHFCWKRTVVILGKF